MLEKHLLEVLYLENKLSSNAISKHLKCSAGQVNYWLTKYGISKRNISDAIYQLNNPKGDPFLFNNPKSLEDSFLFGLGLGLFWGEGSKKNLHAIRLSNSDPRLVKKFIDFLVKIYNIDKKKLKFQLQIYDDLKTDKLVCFWAKYLSVKDTQFYKTTILERRGRGTYLKKMEYGVIILNFGNIKLRNLICSQIANL
jgi:hypothetical protein